MRRASRVVLAAAIAFTFSAGSEAVAGFVSGKDLLDSCSPQKADPVYRLKVAECRGYVIGVADTFDCKRLSSGFGWDSAAPTTQRALVEKVVLWLRSHPETLSFQANGLVAAALSEAHPCSETHAELGLEPQLP